MGLGLHTEVHHLGQPPFFERLPQLLAVAEPSRCAAARKVENIVNSKRLSSPIRSHSHFFGEYKVLNRNFIFHDLIPRTTAIVFDLAKILGAKQNSDILLTSSTYEEEYTRTLSCSRRVFFGPEHHLFGLFQYLSHRTRAPSHQGSRT
jgi:hypothetical protein